MKSCGRCQQPMISAGAVCGACEPPKGGVQQIEEVLDSVEKGHNRYRETITDVSQFEDAAPPSRCFNYWDTSEDVALLMASEISGHRLSYGQGRRRFWPGAEESHPNYRASTIGGIV